MKEIRVKTNEKKAGYDIQKRDEFLGGKEKETMCIDSCVRIRVCSGMKEGRNTLAKQLVPHIPSRDACRVLLCALYTTKLCGLRFLRTKPRRGLITPSIPCRGVGAPSLRVRQAK